jgi:hypothetical protein
MVLSQCLLRLGCLTFQIPFNCVCMVDDAVFIATMRGFGRIPPLFYIL